MPFIVFEGGEGSGKTTQLNLLAHHLVKMGLPIVVTRQPGGTSIGAKLREIILSGEEIDPTTEFFLHMADKHEHVKCFIKPMLNSGHFVLCDRFTMSTEVYQSIQGVPKEMIKKIMPIATLNLVPDLMIVLNVDPKIGISRAKERSNKFDKYDAKTLSFHKKVQNEYLRLSLNNQSAVVINADIEPEFIFEDILLTVNQIIFQK